MVRAHIAAALALFGFAGAAAAQPPLPPPAVENRPAVLVPQHHDVTVALRDMPLIAPGLDQKESPHAPLPVRGRPRSPGGPDGALQITAPSASSITPISNFEGIGNIDGVLPPDTNGDVGPGHYIQWVNLSFAIYRKSDGAVLLGPASGKTLWQGFGGPCETSNDGDPIVLYDEQAGRWLMSQFALPSYPRGPYYQCIAVSQTGDPTGAWSRYSYSFSKLNDYPKFGVWADGYYMSINQFSCTVLGCSWAGQGVAVFERSQMLAGAAARSVYFDMASDATLGGMLPADVDGAPPPSGSPEYFMQFDDQPDQLQLWQFRVNWTNPSASTFTRKALLATASFDSNMCAGSRNCIPQPGTSNKVDAIADRLMYRLQYRNFGDHETLVTNHTVNVGSNVGGVRWYEVRNPASTPVIYQQGTFAPSDALNRWMASAAMDAAGNMAIGYSVSNTLTYPSVRFSGRNAGDPAGSLSIAESDLRVGTGSETHTSGRWGDYSMLSVDPTDGCTFWYTTEYFLAGATSAGWRTNIGSFRLPSCGTTPPAAPPAAPTSLGATATSATNIDLAWSDNSSDETGFVIERCADSLCATSSQAGTTGANVVRFSDAGLAASTTYWYRVKAVNDAGPSGYSNIASATTPASTLSLHVSNLAPSSSMVGKAGWKATVTITVVDSNNAPVPNATVNGAWSNGYSGSASCLTGTAGTCSVTTGKIATNAATVDFTVTGVSGPLPYDGTTSVKTVKVIKP